MKLENIDFNLDHSPLCYPILWDLGHPLSPLHTQIHSQRMVCQDAISENSATASCHAEVVCDALMVAPYVLSLAE